jgi:hypothetical protein
MNFADTIRDRKEVHVPIWGNEIYSYPIPARDKNGTIYRVFIYTINKDNLLDAGLPYSLLEFSAKTGDLVSYNKLDYDIDRDRLFLIYANTEESITNNRDKIISLFDKISELHLFSDNLSDSDVMLLEEYVNLLLSSVPPNHVYYYKKYGKDFFSWVEKLTK